MRPIVAATSLLALVSAQAPEQPGKASASVVDPNAGMVWIAGGEAVLGSQNGDRDAPRHRVRLDGFWLDATEVTNAQFAAFVAATGYVTDAEKPPSKADVPDLPDDQRVAGSLVFTPPPDAVDLRQFWTWWQFVRGADWRHPGGPGSSLAGKDEHPVVHVSWRDANAYAAWAKKRLPSEAEWEFAARGGLAERRYVWGDEAPREGAWHANIWQGRFPQQNSGADGFATTAPVRTFAPNAFGLYGMSGNVWEWCEDRYRPDGYGDGKQIVVNPRGPADSFDPQEPGVEKRVMRGGSFLCSDEYCLGYLPGTRMKSTPDTSLCHTGFRCARTAPAPAGAAVPAAKAAEKR